MTTRKTDPIGQTYSGLINGSFKPEFLQVAKVTEKIFDGEHVQALKVALCSARYTLEKAFIEAALEKNMFKFIAVARDLNLIRNLQWKVEQDSKK